LGIPGNSTDVYNNYVSIKMSNPSVTREDQSLEYEINVYKYVHEKLLETRSTPHLPALVYNGINVSGKELLSANTSTIMKSMNSPTRPFTGNVNFLIAEWIAGKFVGDVLKDNKLDVNSEDINTITFQLAWTCWVMSLVGAQHNDLHTGNIFMFSLKQPTYMAYFVDENNYFLVKCRYMIKIYDFDRGYVSSLGPNASLRSFSQVGMYNRVEPRFDFYTALCVMGYGINQRPDLSPQFDKTVRYIFNTSSPLNEIFHNWPHACRPCKLKTQRECVDTPSSTDLDFIPNLPDIMKRLAPLKNLKTDGYDPVYLPANKDDFMYFFERSSIQSEAQNDAVRKGYIFAQPGVNRKKLTDNIIYNLSALKVFDG